MAQVKEIFENVYPKIRCKGKELEALLSFKTGLSDHFSNLKNRLLDPDDRLSLKFSTHLGTLGNWNSVELKLIELKQLTEFDTVFNKLLETVKKEKIIDHLMAGKTRLISALESEFSNLLSIMIKEKREAELINVESKLTGSIIYNLTPFPEIPPVLEFAFSNGRKFIPHYQEDSLRTSWFVDNQISSCITTMFKSQLSTMGHSINPRHLREDLTTLATNPLLTVEDVSFIQNLLQNLDNLLPTLNSKEPGLDLKIDTISNLKDDLGNDLVLLESDKDQGVTLLSKDQALELYDRANEDNDYIAVDLTEKAYLKSFMAQRDKLLPVIPPEVSSLLTPALKRGLRAKKGSMATLRLLVKIQKLPEVHFKYFSQVKCRLIKASSSDPVGGVAAVLSTMTKPMIEDLKNLMLEEFGFVTGLNGCDEAFQLLNSKSKNSIFNKEMSYEADAVDLYLRISYSVAKSSIIKIFQLVNRPSGFRKFYLDCLTLVMFWNYFKEPKGIHTPNPNKDPCLSIGCKFAADGSEAVLLIYEYDILWVIRKSGLLMVIRLFCRFRDDLYIRLRGDIQETLEVLKSIAIGYPGTLDIKFKASQVYGEFLDISVVSFPEGIHQLELLRKPLSTYDFANSNSNTTQEIKNSALYSQQYRSIRRCNENSGERHQLKVGLLIASKRGFSKSLWTKLLKNVRSNSKNDRTSRVTKSYKKKYTGGFTFDRSTGSHVILRNLFVSSHLPSRNNKPINLPGKNVWSYFFTKRSFLKNVREYYECNKT